MLPSLAKHVSSDSSASLHSQHLRQRRCHCLSTASRPFDRRDSDLDLLSISSMIPWMWSPEIPASTRRVGGGEGGVGVSETPGDSGRLWERHPRKTTTAAPGKKQITSAAPPCNGNWEGEEDAMGGGGAEGGGGGGGAPAFSFFP
ncbi:hypothetical protein EYF80_051651 [Liparis tanakae]|uniref:Uncharacterized protein n=1 Tax=Liparis tanakae TaxID=230148 RepID=A0A4Z2FBN5_9TELE|nr:hypothetical protein EYF80_051651 [Liparis tanakae]